MSDPMSDQKAEIGSVDPELFRDSLALINLSIGQKEGSLYSLNKFSETPQVRRQLANQLIMTPGCDIRTQAAYFINRFSWNLSCIIGFLDLNQLDLSFVWEGGFNVAYTWESYIDEEDKEHQYTVYKWHLDELRASSEQSKANVIGLQLIELMTPFIDIVYQETGLSKGSQWRLVTDAISAVYLQAGKQFGFVEGAMKRVTDIIESAGKPLTNKLWHFKKFEVNANKSPNLKDISGWFRIRGGCCRYYTISNGRYCGTCVHLDKVEQQERFEDYLIKQVSTD